MSDAGEEYAPCTGCWRETPVAELCEHHGPLCSGCCEREHQGWGTA